MKAKITGRLLHLFADESWRNLMPMEFVIQDSIEDTHNFTSNTTRDIFNTDYVYQYCDYWSLRNKNLAEYEWVIEFVP